MIQNIKKDEWAVVLDFLAKGHSGMSRSQPAAQVIGDKYFSLLEVIIREGNALKPGDKVYIGDKKRDQVQYISGRIEMKDLTAAAKDELLDCIEKIVESNQEYFLKFFNESTSLTTRQHQLELLPGVGKKHLWAILDERKVGPFKSFDEIKTRVPLIPDPKTMVVKRIIEELEEKDRYSFFVLKLKEQEDKKPVREVLARA
ncbi:MAG: DUF655 domain-containing protein [Candidatus Aenigmarchaeota archaeon]|nr:DUF655 domain-containing protein [Candidatus Aenigmarchaeota archaeon]